MAKIAVIVINWNNWQDTVACLESLSSAQGVDLSVVLVDNASKNDSVKHLDDFLKGYKLETKFLKSTQNDGFSGAVNNALDSALAENPDYFYLLNNDAKATPETLQNLVAFSERTSAPVVGSVTKDPETQQTIFNGMDGPQYHFGFRQKPPFDPEMRGWRTAYVEGSGLLAKREFVESCIKERGFFLDPELFMYCEDTDLGSYILSQEQQMWVSSESVIYHESSKSGGGLGNPLAYYYITRNRVRVANRWLPLPLKILFHLYYIPSRILLAFNKLIRGRTDIVKVYFEGIKDAYSGHFGKWQKHPDN